MHRIKIGRRKRKLPESWAELRPGSLYFVIRTLLTYKRNVAILIIIQKLLKIKYHTLQLIPIPQLQELVGLLDWMDLRDLTYPIFSRIKIKKNFLQKIKILTPEILTMPGEKFDTGTAYQYAAAVDHYKKYISEKKDIHLDRLLAVLYHPEIISDEKIKQLAPDFSTLHSEVRVAGLAYFAGIQKYIYDTYRYWLFESSGDDAISTQVNFGWWGRYMDIAENRVFGNLEDVYRTSFIDICVFLIQKKEQYLATKKKMEKK